MALIRLHKYRSLKKKYDAEFDFHDGAFHTITVRSRSRTVCQGMPTRHMDALIFVFESWIGVFVIVDCEALSPQVSEPKLASNVALDRKTPA